MGEKEPFDDHSVTSGKCPGCLKKPKNVSPNPQKKSFFEETRDWYKTNPPPKNPNLKAAADRINAKHKIDN